MWKYVASKKFTGMLIYITNVYGELLCTMPAILGKELVDHCPFYCDACCVARSVFFYINLSLSECPL